MEYAVIDLEGSTVGAFEDASSARTFLRRSARGDGYALAELGVLGYRDGLRVGEPRPASEFLLPGTSVKLAVTQAEPLAAPTGQNVVLKLEQRPTPSRRLLDAMILSRLGGIDIRREAVA